MLWKFPSYWLSVVHKQVFTSTIHPGIYKTRGQKKVPKSSQLIFQYRLFKYQTVILQKMFSNCTFVWILRHEFSHFFFFLNLRICHHRAKLSALHPSSSWWEYSLFELIIFYNESDSSSVGCVDGWTNISRDFTVIKKTLQNNQKNCAYLFFFFFVKKREKILRKVQSLKARYN